MLVLLLATPAAAATFPVNDASDPGNGVCNSNCTLAEAIDAANSASGTDTIVFDFPSPTTITLTGDLPDINERVTIDGYTCGSCGATEQTSGNASAGLTATLGITIVGLSGSPNPVLHVTTSADGTLIKGLNIQGAGGDAIEIEGDDTVVSGCFLGTNLTGTAAAGNNDGVYINDAPDVVIGPYNLISGNNDDGIEIDGDQDRTIILSNLIGTDITATSALGNADNGIYFDADGEMKDVEVGDGTASGANVISANGTASNEHGIHVSGNVRGTDANNRSIIAFNFIGTDGTGTVDLGNSGDGIHIDGNGDDAQFWAITDNIISGNGGDGLYGTDTQKANVFSNWIGTNPVGADLGNDGDGVFLEAMGEDKDAKKWIIGGVGNENTIAFNGGDGVRFKDSGGSKQSKQSTVGANSIHSNDGIGIDLEAGATTGDGPSAGSCTDDTAWGNRNMARPVITTANLSIPTTLDLTGTACNNATIDIYIADGDATGFGEPITYLGTTTSDSVGIWTASLTVSGVIAGDEVTALASDTSGDPETSEAALNITVTETVICVDDDNDGVTTCGADGLPATTADNDCDDTDINNYPGNTEICDAADNNCDSTVDDGFDEIGRASGRERVCIHV